MFTLKVQWVQMFIRTAAQSITTKRKSSLPKQLSKLKPSATRLFKSEHQAEIRERALLLLDRDQPPEELTMVDPNATAEAEAKRAQRLRAWRASRYITASSQLMKEYKDSGRWEELEARASSLQDESTTLSPEVQRQNREKALPLFRDFAKYAYQHLGICMVIAYGYENRTTEGDPEGSINVNM